jgi:starch synthase
MTSSLFATSEVLHLIKTGGLGDVSGALPAALREIGVDCRILLPGYRQVMSSLPDLREVARIQETPNFGTVRLLEGRIPASEVPLYVIDSPPHYEREGGPYQDEQGLDFTDNPWRFALLSRIAALLAGPKSPLPWRPDLLHCNDWQTGLAPAYLHYAGHKTPSIITIHNLAHQGVFPPKLVTQVGLPAASFSVDGVEYYGNFCFLKAGLFYSDWITTVSPSYAREIQHAPLGMGMHGLLFSRRAKLTGILNGIDTADWNPSSDVHLKCEYSSRAISGKKRCKQALQEEMGLEVDARAPLFGVVSRLAPQKGLDWVVEVTARIVEKGGQLVALGTGEKAIEQAVGKLVRQYPGRVAAFIGYDEALSHRIEAGIDIFLMPSRFEPCGLNQMYSLRYGAVPVVHATGGLKDTVEDGVTGFVYHRSNADNLWLTIERALALYEDKPAWRRMMQAGMQQDFSWEKSAREYEAVYKRVIASK